MQKPYDSRYILDVSKEYSQYVNATRALPQAGDGLKDAMRKAMWLMRSRGKIKTKALDGAMQEQNIYNHGDACGSICSLAAPFGNNLPLLDALGDFGTRIDPSKYGAPRYTEVQRSLFAEKVFMADIDILEMNENFDSSTMTPKSFLSLLPPLLINGMSGIGVGHGVKIFPRNPYDIVDAICKLLEGKDIPLLKPYYNWCDVDVEFMGYSPKGKAQWLFSGKLEVLDTSTVRVMELPPELLPEKFKEFLISLEADGKIVGFEDRSSSSIDIIVKFKRGSLKDKTTAELIDFLKMRYRRTENFVVNGWDDQRIISYIHRDGNDPVDSYLRDWVFWRFEKYVPRYEFLVNKSLVELALQKLIRECFNVDLPSLLPKIKNRGSLREKITAIGKSAKIPENPDHINYIADLPLYRWTKEHQEENIRKIKALESDIKEWTDIIASDDRRIEIFREEVKGTTAIIKASEVILAELRGNDNV